MLKFLKLVVIVTPSQANKPVAGSGFFASLRMTIQRLLYLFGANHFVRIGECQRFTGLRHKQKR
jgi:hypothetical protein